MTSTSQTQKFEMTQRGTGKHVAKASIAYDENFIAVECECGQTFASANEPEAANEMQDRFVEHIDAAHN